MLLQALPGRELRSAQVHSLSALLCSCRSKATAETPPASGGERPTSYALPEPRPPSSGEWSLVSGGSFAGGSACSCSSAEDQSPWEKVGTHEARVAAYLARGMSPVAVPVSSCAEMLNRDEHGDCDDCEDGVGIRASDLPDARLDFGDGTDSADMSSAIAALRARLGHVQATDGASHVTPSIAELRDRLGQVEPPPGITLTEEQRRELSDAWRSEQSSANGAVELSLCPHLGAIGLAGDPNEGIDPTAHDAPPSQTDVLNQRLLATFKDSLDRVGAGYCPMMEQISSEPGNFEQP